MPGPALPLMPMGLAAAKSSGAPSLPLPPLTGSGPAPATPPPMAPPPDMPAPAPLPPMQPGGMFPAPNAPAQPPFDVRMQPDGSSVYIIPSPDGDPAKDIVLGINPPPKLPKAMQPAPAAPSMA